MLKTRHSASNFNEERNILEKSRTHVYVHSLVWISRANEIPTICIDRKKGGVKTNQIKEILYVCIFIESQTDGNKSSASNGSQIIVHDGSLFMMGQRAREGGGDVASRCKCVKNRSRDYPCESVPVKGVRCRPVFGQRVFYFHATCFSF